MGKEDRDTDHHASPAKIPKIINSSGRTCVSSETDASRLDLEGRSDASLSIAKVSGKSVLNKTVLGDSENSELALDISLSPNSYLSSLSDQTNSIVTSETSTSLLSSLSFDVPTIITSHTSDLDDDIVDAAKSCDSDNSSGVNVLCDVKSSSSSNSANEDKSRKLDNYVLCVPMSEASTTNTSLLSSSSCSSGDGGSSSPVLCLSPNKSDDNLTLATEPGNLEFRRLSSLSVDMSGIHRRRSSCPSVDACSLSGCGILCACSGDETHSDRRGSVVSSTDDKQSQDDITDNATEGMNPITPDSHKPESRSKITDSISVPLPIEIENTFFHGSLDSVGELSSNLAASKNTATNISIQSVDSEVISLLSSDVLSTLLRNRFQKYEKSVFDPNSEEEGFDGLSLTSSMRVEYDSHFEDSQVDISKTESLKDASQNADVSFSKSSGAFPEDRFNVIPVDHFDNSVDFHDKTQLIDSTADNVSAGPDEKYSVDASLSHKAEGASQSSRVEDECISLTLSADADDVAIDAFSSNDQRKSSRDLYTKLEQMRRIKRSAEPQHSMNNLLMSDNGSEQASLYARQPSESSICAMYSEDTVSCRSRSSRKNKDYYDGGSQINSEDSASVRSRPMKDPESVSQMYTSEDSTSYKQPRFAKDYESISQTPTYDIADLESINERLKLEKRVPKNVSRRGRILRRRRASDISTPSGEGVSRVSIASTTRTPFNCCKVS